MRRLSDTHGLACTQTHLYSLFSSASLSSDAAHSSVRHDATTDAPCCSRRRARLLPSPESQPDVHGCWGLGECCFLESYEHVAAASGLCLRFSIVCSATCRCGRACVRMVAITDELSCRPADAVHPYDCVPVLRYTTCDHNHALRRSIGLDGQQASSPQQSTQANGCGSSQMQRGGVVQLLQ